MKTKPEYREVFTSPTIFARILHTLSVQKYKLNVRRYILDLFDIQLDVDAVKAISDARRSLRTVSPKPAATLSNPAPPARLRAFSVIGRPGRSRNTESDDTDSEEEGATKAMVPERPVMSLRPMSRIVGFQ